MKVGTSSAHLRFVYVLYGLMQALAKGLPSTTQAQPSFLSLGSAWEDTFIISTRLSRL